MSVSAPIESSGGNCAGSNDCFSGASPSFRVSASAPLSPASVASAGRCCTSCGSRGVRFASVFFASVAITALIAFPLGPLPGLGQEFFPSVDGGQIKLHLRARSGTRIEETAVLADGVEGTIREVIPPSEIVNVVDNIGLPYSGINLAYSTSAPVGPGDADIYVNLKPHHKPTADYVRELRARLATDYPGSTFAFLPADMIGQILNFGLPSAIDVQIVGFNTQGNRDFANQLLEKLRSVPGAVDLHVQQAGDYPQFNVDVDRSKAQLLGLTEQATATSGFASRGFRAPWRSRERPH